MNNYDRVNKAFEEAAGNCADRFKDAMAASYPHPQAAEREIEAMRALYLLSREPSVILDIAKTLFPEDQPEKK